MAGLLDTDLAKRGSLDQPSPFGDVDDDDDDDGDGQVNRSSLLSS